MARKKASQQQQQQQQENPPKEVLQMEKPHETTMEDCSEKLSNLKSLNALLLKETVKRRQQVDSLVQSKESLESEISRTLLDKQRLESEKFFFQDETIVADLEQRLTLTFVSSQLNQQAESLKNEIRKANEETRAQTAVFEAKLKEKINDKEKSTKATETRMEEQQKEMNQMSDDFRRYRNEVRKDLDLKQKEANRLRSTVVALEKSNAEAREEIGQMQMEGDEVRQETEKRYGDLKREMEAAVREKGEIEAATKKQFCEINSLKKSLAVLTADLSSEREASERVLREKDLIQQHLDTHIEEIKSLRSTLLKLEKSRSDTHDEHHRLQTKHKLLLEDKEKMEMSLAALERDKASAERSLIQSTQQIEDLKREVTEVVADKQQIQYEKTQQAVEINERKKEVAQLSSTISSLQKQEEGLQLKISEMGSSNADAQEKQQQLLMEFNVLVKEKEENEKLCEKLMEANQSLEESYRRIKEQWRKVQEIVIEKDVIEQVKIKLEAEIFELHEEIRKLRATVSTLYETCREHEENSNQLKAEAIQNRDAHDRVVLERDDALKLLKMEKKEYSTLRLKLLELEKNLKETKEEIAQLHTERDNLVMEGKEMEGNLQLLTEEKASLQKAMLEAQQGPEDQQVKMISTDKLSDRTLSMLKDTVAIVRGSAEEKDGKGEAGIGSEKIEVEIQPIAAEFEAIKRAFRNKDAKMEDLSQQLRFLENSVIEEKKKRSFWTLLSSVTTIFAAASVAYVAKGH